MSPSAAPPPPTAAVGAVPARQDWAGRRVLVTGGLGFIGSNLARRLADLGAAVTVVDNLTETQGGNRFNLDGYQERFRVVEADVGDAKRLPALVEGASVVFNLAAATSHLDSMRDPLGDLEVNCRAQLALLEACRLHAKDAVVVFTSTRQVYGKPERLPVDETHRLAPPDINGIHKAAGEAYHTLYHRVHGLRTTVLRLTNVYGPRMRIKDARQTFLGVWVRDAVEGKPFEVWGGEQVRDFTFVDDLVEALLLSADPALAGRILNIGGSPPVSLKTAADTLVAEAGAAARYEVREFPAERKRIDIGDYATDDRRFRSLTGWTPRTDLGEGFRRSLAYYRRHLARYL